jgi:tight adherence protein B
MMLLSIVVFVLTVAAIMGLYFGATRLPAMLAARRLDQRLRDVSADPKADDSEPAEDSVLKDTLRGPLPAVDRMMAGTDAGSKLARLIEQAGAKITPSAVIVMTVGAAAGCAVVAYLFIHLPFAPLAAGALGGFAPIAWLVRKKSTRMRKFEEHFPEALDLLSRAIRAGHAFQTAMGMVADELPDPIGPEFKKTFDQQNYGLPLRDALTDLSERLGLLDVRFFVTAVLIQRDTGGNLSEILDNLANVVRERFKIKRQVRVHTAHGRFTGYVLLALPAALAMALSVINPEHMELLFREHMGHVMLGGAIVMQTIGFFWIRQVIKIEV